jgi:prepilin-type N-terminal cleavage/methylation domain-containing protein
VSRGFTLVEMVVVLALIGILAGVTVPALESLDSRDPAAAAAEPVMGALDAARRTALRDARATTLTIDPRTAQYAITEASDSGRAIVQQGVLALAAGVRLETSEPRLRFRFEPGGSVYADSFVVRFAGGASPIVLDPWMGDVRAPPR